MLSNFGLLDKNRLIFAGASIDDAFELGPVMFKHGLMLTASTYNDRLTLASGYCRDYINSAVIEGLLQQVVDELVSLVNETLTVPMRASVFSSN
ncbi:MAG: hypothetical protein LWX83_12305 [Anaerolineae bacterium]|nr:hypothetical protein [Anaerolineae bacterium]